MRRLIAGDCRCRSSPFSPLRFLSLIRVLFSDQRPTLRRRSLQFQRPYAWSPSIAIATPPPSPSRLAAPANAATDICCRRWIRHRRRCVSSETVLIRRPHRLRSSTTSPSLQLVSFVQKSPLILSLLTTLETPSANPPSQISFSLLSFSG